MKSEPIEAAPGADLEEAVEPENASDHEQVTHENQEQIEVDAEPGGTGEQLPSAVSGLFTWPPGHLE